MRTKLAFLILGAMLVCNAHAANWYAFTSVGNDNAVYFFDWDTAVKQPAAITIWIKYINSENAPEKDGSFATATKYNVDCKRKTMQAMIQVTYDKNQIPMETLNTPGRPFESAPGSIGEALVHNVCATDFLNKKSDKHLPVPNNDIYGFAKTFFTLRNDPAPK